MEALQRLNEAVQSVLDAADEVKDDINAAVWQKAPLIVHQKFCSELMAIAKKHKGQDASKVPEFMDVLKAIEVIERLYPELYKPLTPKNNP